MPKANTEILRTSPPIVILRSVEASAIVSRYKSVSIPYTGIRLPSRYNIRIIAVKRSFLHSNFSLFLFFKSASYNKLVTIYHTWSLIRLHYFIAFRKNRRSRYFF